MKKKRLFTFLAAAILLAGCSNPNVDSAKVRAALAALDPGNMALLDQALTNIDTGKYSEAVLPLKKIAFGAKLDKDQAQVLRDTMTKVQAKIAKGQ